MMEAHEIFAALNTPAAICGASALLFGGAVIDRACIWYAERRLSRRLYESTRDRVRRLNSTAGVPAAPAIDQVRDLDAGRPESVAPERGREPSGPLVSMQSERSPVVVRESRSSQAAVFVRPSDQVDDFVAFVREMMLGKHPDTGRWECKLSDQRWVEAYRRWAHERAIVVVPVGIFLKYLRQQSGVLKTRDRLKCPETGAVLKNAAGTPLRCTYYTVTEAPPVERAVDNRKTRRTTLVERPPAAEKKSRSQILAELEHGPDDETWAEAARRAA